jgi:hypothetical protein
MYAVPGQKRQQALRKNLKSEYSPLEKFCPGSPFEPSFSPRRGLLLCSTIR